MTRLRTTTPTLLLAAGCLLLGSTGGAVAAKLITGADIKNGSLTGADLAPNSVSGTRLRIDSVGSGKISNDSLTGADLREDTLRQVPLAIKAGTASFVEQGGVDSNAIVSGAVGGAELGKVIVRADAIPIAPGGTQVKLVTCEPGEVVLGGGTIWNNVNYDGTNAANLRVVYSGPNPTTNGWQARGYNGTNDPDAALEVLVRCLQ